MDQQTVTYLLIAALLATAVLIALAVVVPRMPRRVVGVMAAATAAAHSAVSASATMSRGPDGQSK